MGTFDKLPGIDDSNTTRRNVVVGGVYALAGCVVVGGITGDGEDAGNGNDGEDTGDENDTPTPDAGTDPSNETDEPDDDADGEGGSTASFEVVGIDHPDEVGTGEEHTLTVEVENVGDAAGDFERLLEISVAGEDSWENVGIITIEGIDPGETSAWQSDEVSFDTPATVQYRLGNTEWEYDVTITEPDAQSFSGSGQTVEQGIDIEGGLVVVEGSHDGESNFQVSLVDDSEFDDNFINVVGEFDGAQAELIDAGEYILDINADGNWDVTVRQPRSGQGEALPASFAGSGPDVVGPVQFEGTGVAAGEHDGESNFQVQIYPMTGSFGESLFNEIGAFEGETTYSFDGIGWVDVNADGSWSLGLE